MKLRHFSAVLILSGVFVQAHAQATEGPNIIRSAATIGVSVNDGKFWKQIEAYVSEWENLGAERGCSLWSPDPATQTIGLAFTQTQSCLQDQVQTVQQREQNEKTQQIRNLGDPVSQNRSVNTSHNRDAVGELESWVAASPVYSDWVSKGSIYGCSDWSPASSTYTASATFTQKSTNCTLDQGRTAQAREQETTTGSYRNLGEATNETRTLTGQASSRAYTVVLGPWINSGVATNCSNWSPDPSTVNAGVAFTQTATNCTQGQTRNRTEEYQEDGNVVPVSSTSEKQTISATSTRSATGTKADYINDANNYAACEMLMDDMWSYYIISGGKMVYQDSVCGVSPARGNDGIIYSTRQISNPQPYIINYSIKKN